MSHARPPEGARTAARQGEGIPVCPDACLMLPRLALSGCVRAYLSRSTRGVPLAYAQRLNRFPASPLCAITWFLHGECRMLPWHEGVPPEEAAGEPLAPVLFNGAYERPSMSVSCGEGQAFMLLLLPDAFQALTGHDAGRWRNQAVPAEQVFDAAWLPLFQAVRHADNDSARIALVEDFLAPRWAGVRRDGPAMLRSTHDWAQALALRAATSGLGRSVRQMERRIKAWSGLPLRDLRGLARAEQSYYQAMQAHREGRLDWARVAQTSGYADQSHFCRETRRVTGYSPQALRVLMDTDESFWVYRIWG